MGNIVYDLKKKKTIWPTMQAAKTLEKKKKEKRKRLECHCAALASWNPEISQPLNAD